MTCRAAPGSSYSSAWMRRWPQAGQPIASLAADRLGRGTPGEPPTGLQGSGLCVTWACDVIDPGQAAQLWQPVSSAAAGQRRAGFRCDPVYRARGNLVGYAPDLPGECVPTGLRLGAARRGRWCPPYLVRWSDGHGSSFFPSSGPRLSSVPSRRRRRRRHRSLSVMATREEGVRYPPYVRILSAGSPRFRPRITGHLARRRITVREGPVVTQLRDLGQPLPGGGLGVAGTWPPGPPQSGREASGLMAQRPQRGPCCRDLYVAAAAVRWKVVPTLFWMKAPGRRRAIAWVAFQSVQ